MTVKKILSTFLFLNFFILLYGYFIGFNKSFWLDELLSIIYARELSSLNLKEILAQDPNAPFFYLLLNISEMILANLNFNNNENINLLRIINIIGLIPIFLAYKILKNQKIEIDINILFLLLISSNYFFQYILELRPYFLLLGFTFLISVLNLTNTLENRHKYLFLFSSIIISVLHIYGLTISMSILLYRLLLNFFQKNYDRFKVDILFMSLLFLIFLLSYFMQITNPEMISKLGYLKFHLWFVRAFLNWNLNTFVFLTFTGILVIFLNIKKSQTINSFIKVFLNNKYLNIFGQIAPILILLTVVSIVSFLITPIIHFRQLVVIYPGLVLTGGLIAFNLFKKKELKILLSMFLIFLTYVNVEFYFKNIENSEQNIKWVVKKAFTENCKDHIVYFNDDNKENILDIVNPMVKIYSRYERPIKPLSSIKLAEYENLKKKK